MKPTASDSALHWHDEMLAPMAASAPKSRTSETGMTEGARGTGKEGDTGGRVDEPDEGPMRDC